MFGIMMSEKTTSNFPSVRLCLYHGRVIAVVAESRNSVRGQTLSQRLALYVLNVFWHPPNPFLTLNPNASYVVSSRACRPSSAYSHSYPSLDKKLLNTILFNRRSSTTKAKPCTNKFKYTKDGESKHAHQLQPEDQFYEASPYVCRYHSPLRASDESEWFYLCRRPVPCDFGLLLPLSNDQGGF